MNFEFFVLTSLRKKWTRIWSIRSSQIGIHCKCRITLKVQIFLPNEVIVLIENVSNISTVCIIFYILFEITFTEWPLSEHNIQRDVAIDFVHNIDAQEKTFSNGFLWSEGINQSSKKLVVSGDRIRECDSILTYIALMSVRISSTQSPNKIDDSTKARDLLKIIGR